MHCVECNSENMRMVGSISSPSWQCADCGSARPPVHAHDKAPAVRDGEQVGVMDVHITDQNGKSTQLVDPWAVYSFEPTPEQVRKRYGYDPYTDTRDL